MTGPRTKLFYGRKPLLEVVPDAEYPAMWRVVWPDGSLSDMANIARAKDAAMVGARALGIINHDSELLHWEHGWRPSAAPPLTLADDGGGAA